jgi:hypothetical protein
MLPRHAPILAYGIGLPSGKIEENRIFFGTEIATVIMAEEQTAYQIGCLFDTVILAESNYHAKEPAILAGRAAMLS